MPNLSKVKGLKVATLACLAIAMLVILQFKFSPSPAYAVSAQCGQLAQTCAFGNVTNLNYDRNTQTYHWDCCLGSTCNACPAVDQQPATASIGGVEGKDYAAGEVVVTFKPDVSVNGINVKNILKNTAATLAEQKNQTASTLSIDSAKLLTALNINYVVKDVVAYQFSPIVLVKVPDGLTMAQAIADLQQNPNVEYAAPDYFLKLLAIPYNDPGKGQQWGLENTGQDCGQVPGVDVNAVKAWEVCDQGHKQEVIVAIIDGGGPINYYQPDLDHGLGGEGQPALWDGRDCVDENGNRIGDCKHGYNYTGVGDPRDPDTGNSLYPDSYYAGHGAAIAGVIAAHSDNGLGIVGLAPNARLMLIQANTYDQVIKAINFAYNNGAKIINMSFNSTYFDQNEFNAIKNFLANNDRLIVAAAGNDFENIDNEPEYPASLNNFMGINNLISVAASDSFGQLTTWAGNTQGSNYGQHKVDLAAPGKHILSIGTITNQTVFLDGTSIAAPFVVAAAAMIWGNEPDLTASEVKARIVNNGDPMYVIPNELMPDGKRVTRETRSNRTLNIYNALIDCQPETFQEICSQEYADCGLTHVYNKALPFINRCGKKVYNIPCGSCPSGSSCNDDHKCVKCDDPSTLTKLCDSNYIQCGSKSVTDFCGNQRTIDCPNKCRTNRGETCANNTCVSKKTVPGNSAGKSNTKNPCPDPNKDCGKAPYDQLGQSLTDGGYYRRIVIKGNAQLDQGIAMIKRGLNYGLRINLGQSSADQAVVSRYCYGNDANNCNKYDALYTYDEVSVDGDGVQQGICPDGYHVPTAAEWDSLLTDITTPGKSCVDNRSGWDCSGAATILKKSGLDDFQATVYPSAGSSFYSNLPAPKVKGASNYQGYISATTDPNNSDNFLAYFIADKGDQVAKRSMPKSGVYGLRCFEDCDQGKSSWSDWQAIGACGEFKVGTQEEYRVCNRSCGSDSCSGNNYREIPCDAASSCDDLIKIAGGPCDKYGLNCGSGQGYYRTININGVCWLKDNLNIGVKIPLINEPAKNNTVEKWCLDDNEANCAKTGGLYSLQETTGNYIDYLSMKKSPTSQLDDYGIGMFQGICPTGWRLPTKDEADQLVSWSGFDQGVLNQFNWQAGGARGEDKYTAGHGDPGFTALLTSSGYIGHDPDYELTDPTRAMLYGQSILNSNIDFSTFNPNKSLLMTTALPAINGYNVRCVKGGSCTPVNGQWTDWQDSGVCGQYEIGKIKQVRTCTAPAPGCGGLGCVGPTSQMISCEVPNCGLVYGDGGPYEADGVTKRANPNDGYGYYRTVLYQGTSINGVEINQCWTRDNWNAGQAMGIYKGNDNLAVYNPQINDSQIEKYCSGYNYNDSPADRAKGLMNCGIFGGLYQYHEALQIPARCDNMSLQACGVQAVSQRQGICPLGWHIPSDSEWYNLESYFSDNLGSSCDPNRYVGGCSKAGAKLRLNGSSKFDALNGGWAAYNLIGVNNNLTSFAFGSNADFWSADPQESDKLYGINRWLDFSTSGNPYLIARNQLLRPSALSVRCLKDCATTVTAIDDLTMIERGFNDYYRQFGYYPNTAQSGQVIVNQGKIFMTYPTPASDSYNQVCPNGAEYNYSAVGYHPQTYTIDWCLSQPACSQPAGNYQAVPGNIYQPTTPGLNQIINGLSGVVQGLKYSCANNY